MCSTIRVTYYQLVNLLFVNSLIITFVLFYHRCPYGWKGESCKEMDGPVIAAIIGGSAGLLFLVVILTTVCCRKKVNIGMKNCLK